MPVSVLIPLYNAEKFLRQSVESALDQPETGEVLIWDDASTDKSLALARELAQQDQRIKVFYNTENKGNYAVRNALIKASTCEYLAFLDADDYFLPARFSVSLPILEKDSSLDGVYEAFENFDNSALEGNDPYLKSALADVPRNIAPEKLFRHLMLYSRYSRPLTIFLCRRSTYNKIPPIPENYVKGMDSIVTYQLAAKCRLIAGKINEPVFRRRLHETNLSIRVGQRRYFHDLVAAKYFVNWVSNNLEQEDILYSRLYIMNYARVFYNLTLLRVVLPYRLFKYLSRIIAHLRLLGDFPVLCTFGEYWFVFLRILLRGEIVFSQKWYQPYQAETEAGTEPLNVQAGI